MSSTVAKLRSKNLLKNSPKFLESNIQYEVIMGSVAYGVSNDTSDMDIYGFAIPMKTDIFPHLAGEIVGFDEPKQRFEQFQQHHIKDPSAMGGKGREYDICIYSITKYFRLLMDNNPNIVDSLFVPRNCILHTTPIGEKVRENRHLFLHKGCWAKFKGYAYSQMHKLKTKEPIGGRKAILETYGYDVKFAYHVARLLLEVEQLLLEGDLQLSRHAEQLKSIRRGDWSLLELEEFVASKENALEQLFLKSVLPDKPDKTLIKQLLIECLEMHYGSLEGAIHLDKSEIRQALEQIQALTGRLINSI
ncbi:nucleotidyltransferase domain-containing protein [Endozoicomonas sp. SM1973]|uniref:Nucleotidyltransferase domain-containing protein n=1 Tax=Spartinivicinus marinus TaxID=2994442 RepID=A0A853IJW3_9GAMM|nr:nucleotidyltransferase domain-containing protein [Spartinivicinus marinus]MCX4027304.1 nucleotidyltransferase domain-containing protein [Spartinivicinus marinus]NYZ67936.1 nucleotidyltransferase domain-containing protein [Spartinivicinus marinus]